MKFKIKKKTILFIEAVSLLLALVTWFLQSAEIDSKEDKENLHIVIEQINNQSGFNNVISAVQLENSINRVFEKHYRITHEELKYSEAYRYASVREFWGYKLDNSLKTIDLLLIYIKPLLKEKFYNKFEYKKYQKSFSGLVERKRAEMNDNYYKNLDRKSFENEIEELHRAIFSDFGECFNNLERYYKNRIFLYKLFFIISAGVLILSKFFEYFIKE